MAWLCTSHAADAQLCSGPWEGAHTLWCVSVLVRMVTCVRSYYEASVFETTIRVVGGILTAHELTGDAELLRRCALKTLNPEMTQTPCLYLGRMNFCWQCQLCGDSTLRFATTMPTPGLV